MIKRVARMVKRVARFIVAWVGTQVWKSILAAGLEIRALAIAAIVGLLLFWWASAQGYLER